MEGVLAGRQVLERRADQHSMRRLLEHGGAGALAVGCLQPGDGDELVIGACSDWGNDRNESGGKNGAVQ
jgi:hypothetical protein